MNARIQHLLCPSQHLLLAFSGEPFYRSGMALGKRLFQARKRRGLTQEQLVEKVPAASQAMISALETRDSETSTLLFALARALRVNPEWLQDGVEPSGLDGTFGVEDFNDKPRPDSKRGGSSKTRVRA